MGSQLRTAGQTLVVTGIIRPRHAGSSFWTVDPVAAAPQLVQPPSINAAPYWGAAVFIGPDELFALQKYLSAEPLRGDLELPA